MTPPLELMGAELVEVLVAPNTIVETLDVHISAIVDGCHGVIVDGVSA